MKKTKGEKVFDIINIAFLLIISFLFIYPFYQQLIISFNDSADAMRGELYFFPRKFTFDNYIAVFKNQALYRAYVVTILRTLIGVATSVVATAMFAYGLSKKQLMFRKFYLTMATATMFFSGGLIPSFLLIKSVGLVDSFWVYIIPSLISVWNVIIMKTFFLSIPVSLEEAAKIDGYNDIQIFFRIVVPTSMPVIAAIALFNGVGHWNAWFDAHIYVNNNDLLPLQTILMRIISQNSVSQELKQLANNEFAAKSRISAESIKVATMMVAIGPIILVYPFLQKYFVQGIMIGAVKE